jgi:hypothetical protein
MPQGLCFRCEHRARFFEEGSCPRDQCSNIHKAITSCYSYQPVVPCVTVPLEESEDDKKKPRFAPDFISAKEQFSRIPGRHEVRLVAVSLLKKEVVQVYEKTSNKT